MLLMAVISQLRAYVHWWLETSNLTPGAIVFPSSNRYLRSDLGRFYGTHKLNVPANAVHWTEQQVLCALLQLWCSGAGLCSRDSVYADAQVYHIKDMDQA
jgi:hypothetical protein